MFIEWQRDYQLGIPAIDAEHKGLVERLNQFFAAAEAGSPTGELDILLDRLITATTRHFENEEMLLDFHDYPDLVGHRAEHQRLLQQLAHFRDAYDEDRERSNSAFEAADFLRRWLLEHIQSEDRSYRPYVMRLS